MDLNRCSQVKGIVGSNTQSRPESSDRLTIDLTVLNLKGIVGLITSTTTSDISIYNPHSPTFKVLRIGIYPDRPLHSRQVSRYRLYSYFSLAYRII